MISSRVGVELLMLLLRAQRGREGASERGDTRRRDRSETRRTEREQRVDENQVSFVRSFVRSAPSLLGT